jgi:hypothetical protein
MANLLLLRKLGRDDFDPLDGGFGVEQLGSFLLFASPYRVYIVSIHVSNIYTTSSTVYTEEKYIFS